MSETIPLEIAIGARECEDDDAEKVALEIASAINQEDVLPEDIRFDTVVSLRTKNGKIVSVPVVRRH